MECIAHLIAFVQREIQQQGEAYLQFAPNVAKPPKEEGERTVVRRM